MISDSKIESLKKIYGGPMTPTEIEVLNDIKGFIDVAIRNGLSFALVIGTLSHDVNNLRGTVSTWSEQHKTASLLK